MKLAAGKMKTGILLAALTAGSAFAQIPNIVQHVQDKMNTMQQQNKAASDAALKGNATNANSTAKAPAGKPAAATAAKSSAPVSTQAAAKPAAKPATKPASTPVAAKATNAPASQKTTAAATPRPATAKASAPAIAKSVPVKSTPAQSTPAQSTTAKASTPASAKPAVAVPVAAKGAAPVATAKKDPFAKAAVPKAGAKAASAKPADAKADTKAASAKPADTKADAKTDAKEEAPEPKKEGFITAGNRRDPFISPVVQHLAGSGCSTGKRCLEIDQIALRGIVKSEAGMIAVVVNSLDKAYFLRENDPVFNGYVLKISGDTVVFKETVQDKLGHLSTREVVKKITTPAV